MEGLDGSKPLYPECRTRSTSKGTRDLTPDVLVRHLSNTGGRMDGVQEQDDPFSTPVTR